MNLLQILDYGGMAVFAATGALAASRQQLDIIGFLFLAGVTAIGGGTVRDVVLDLPVFWVIDPGHIVVAALVAVVVYFTAHLVESRYKLLLWLDAVGLSAYCVLGAEKALDATGSPIVAILMGTLTATFGGILRDLLAGEPSVLLKPEVYVTAALAGSFVHTFATILGLPLPAAATLAFATAFIVRGGALRYGWTFPRYKSRPGRDPKDIP